MNEGELVLRSRECDIATDIRDIGNIGFIGDIGDIQDFVPQSVFHFET